MDRKEFKKIVNDCLGAHGFSKKGKYYYKESSDIVCALALQKSNYSNSYYVNIGIVIKEINREISLPRDVDGDVRCRFYFNNGGQEVDSINLDDVKESSYIVSSLEEGIEEIVNPSLKLEGLKALLNSKPILLYQTTINAKKYLGFEE